jgi:hypothetical protein
MTQSGHNNTFSDLFADNAGLLLPFGASVALLARRELAWLHSQHVVERKDGGLQ